jgi:hypothetical protein
MNVMNTLTIAQGLWNQAQAVLTEQEKDCNKHHIDINNVLVTSAYTHTHMNVYKCVYCDKY